MKKWGRKAKKLTKKSVSPPKKETSIFASVFGVFQRKKSRNLTGCGKNRAEDNEAS